jgi:hypothetical protein
MGCFLDYIIDSGLRGEFKRKKPRECGAFNRRQDKARLVPNSTPHFIRVDFLVRIKSTGLFQECFGRLGICRIGDTAIIDWAHSGALRFVEMSDAFSATIVGDDIDIISLTLPFTYMIPLTLCIASRFENGLIGTLR